MAGWGDFFGSIGKLFGKIPIQERKERWKNELDKLSSERQELLHGGWTEKKADRIIVVNNRIAQLLQFLKNSASDN
jgi:hypothetical protein